MLGQHRWASAGSHPEGSVAFHGEAAPTALEAWASQALRCPPLFVAFTTAVMWPPRRPSGALAQAPAMSAREILL